MLVRCSLDGCQRQSKTAGLCGMHYERRLRHGSTDARPKKYRTKDELVAIGFIKPKRMADCHPNRPHESKGKCRSCYISAYNKATGKGNDWLKRHPEAARFHRWKNGLQVRHGITAEQWDQMFDEQGGKCANAGCGRQFVRDASRDHRKVMSLQVDHDHESGVIRGLLCKQCNSALGHARDDVSRLIGLAEYLVKHQRLN